MRDTPDTIPSQRVFLASAGVAALVSVAIALVLKLALNVPLPAEVVAEDITALLPLAVFTTLLGIFGSLAKRVLLGGALALVAVAFMGVARAYNWLAPPHARVERGEKHSVSPLYVQHGVGPYLLALPLWLLSLALVASRIALGSRLPGGVVSIALAEAIAPIAFALTYNALIRRGFGAAAETTKPLTDEQQLSRRKLLRSGAIALGVVATGGVLTAVARTIWARLNPPVLHVASVPQKITPPVPNYVQFTPVAGQAPEVTPTDQFYYVSKDLTNDPEVDIARWRLEIKGLVEKPYGLTYAELQTMPYVERYHTLSCISNEIGGPYISNGLFRGVKLADILNAAGIKDTATEVIFHAADDYSDSLHLAQALNPDSLIAYQLNGAPLPTPHGYPARLLIPGLYGMKNGKWLTTLQLGPGGYTGFWEDRGWTREAIVKTMSRIDTPYDGSQIPTRPTTIAGVAYAGDRGISAVEVTTDGGHTWQRAELRRPLGKYTWTLWQFPWTPTPGDHVIGVRAIEADGTVQQPDPAPTLPDGASGYQAIQVTVG